MNGTGKMMMIAIGYTHVEWHTVCTLFRFIVTKLVLGALGSLVSWRCYTSVTATSSLTCICYMTAANSSAHIARRSFTSAQRVRKSSRPWISTVVHELICPWEPNRRHYCRLYSHYQPDIWLWCCMLTTESGNSVCHCLVDSLTRWLRPVAKGDRGGRTTPPPGAKRSLSRRLFEC